MRRVSVMFVVALAATGPGLSAQETTKKESARPGTPAKKDAEKELDARRADRQDDETALKALLDTFIKAFNAGKAEDVAATYTETALVVNETGARVEGRAGIRKQYEASFADDPRSTIAIQVDSRHFLGSETALEEGRATITPADGAGTPEITRFTAVYVKHDGHWLQAAVRDEPSHTLTPHDRLKELEWLVGDWVNESQDAIVATTCKWTDDGNFLVREFTMKTRGEPVLSGSQRIGWDPLKRQFQTWIFDSEGGHAEGHWTRNGDQWTIKIEGVRQDGLPASATNLVTRLGKDRMTWQSVDRTLGGAAIAGIDEFTVVRKPPEVGK